MAYFHTNYDASTMTVSVNDEEVSRALGVLANKTPAALKVAETVVVFLEETE